MTCRKVVTRSGRGFRGYFPSKKLNRMIEWESTLERDAILHFEFSPGVVFYQEQPELIRYEHEGEMRRYFPDFALNLRNSDTIHIEVKPEAKLQAHLIRNKLEAIVERYKTHSASFRLLTDRFLREEPKLTNLKQLAAVQHYQDDLEDVRQRVICLLGKGHLQSVRNLADKFGLKPILILLAKGEICCDLHQALHAPTNLLQLPKEADHDAVLI